MRRQRDTGTFRTGPAGVDGGQSAPLVFLEEATQLAALGFEATGLALADLMRLTAPAAAPRRGAVEPRVGAAVRVMPHTTEAAAMTMRPNPIRTRLGDQFDVLWTFTGGGWVSDRAA
jgi:hypothetical protein